MSKSLHLSAEGGIVVIRIDRAKKKNAFTRDMLRELPELVAGQQKPKTKAIVLTGSDELFSAGVDLSEIGEGASDAGIDDEIAAAGCALRESRVPVIAAIEGACMGAAVELAMSCDLRVVSSKAFFGVPAVRLGILYRPDAIGFLVRELGRQTAARMLVAGDRISGAESQAAGIAAVVTKPGQALMEALRIGALIETSVPDAVMATKAVINAADRGGDLAVFEGLRFELLASDARRAAVEQLRASLSDNRKQ